MRTDPLAFRSLQAASRHTFCATALHVADGDARETAATTTVHAGRAAHGYTRREVLAHTLTHDFWIAACVAVVPWLIVVASSHGETWRLVGGLSALFPFIASTLYHSVIEPQAEHRLRILDHCAIYLLIAGTYTPFTIGALGGTWSWTLFGIVWAVAVLGIAA